MHKKLILQIILENSELQFADLHPEDGNYGQNIFLLLHFYKSTKISRQMTFYYSAPNDQTALDTELQMKLLKNSHNVGVLDVVQLFRKRIKPMVAEVDTESHCVEKK